MSVRHKLELVRHFGPRWVLWRAGYALRKKSGCMKRQFPAISYTDVSLSDVVLEGTPAEAGAYRAFRERSPGRFFFELGRLPAAAALQQVMLPSGREHTIAVADDYCRGRFLYYNRHTFDLGKPVNWLLNPFTGAQHNARTHWCDYATFSPAVGDIKDAWEASRFACAFWLVRAYALTGDEKYATAFWEHFESWCAQNPPHMGPNWKCGQETALRSMAWCFGLYAFWNAAATTPERVTALVKMLALQGERIARNINYAVSQKNNHAFSEAVGLMTLGFLFPELKGAQRWLQLGRRILEGEIRRQLYRDGSYVQQSMNYHRVMLHDCIWGIRLAELNGQPLSGEAMARVADASEFMFQMLDMDSGCVPNYGYNDGALIFPFSACDYRDYRPTIQVARYQVTGRRVLDRGPWDEMLLWFYGPAVLLTRPTVATPTSRRFDVGGYYTLRRRDSWAMVRCHTYRDRPGHVDMLHLDLWYQGINVLGDSGTYRYYAPDDLVLERYFKDLTAHNMIEVDGRGPLDLFARWVWLPWPRAQCLEHRRDYWQGEHYAYARSPWHVVVRRSVRLVDERTWLVTDELLGEGQHDVKLRWHLADRPFRLDATRHGVELDLPRGRMTLEVEGPRGLRTEVRRGWREGERALGWESTYYGAYTPRPTLEVIVTCSLPAQFVTRVSFRKDGGA
jgi:hypothetical protein